MSLMERVTAAAHEKRLPDAFVGGAAIEGLRDKVSELIPPVEAARLIAAHPQQARSELRMAAERVLRDEPWLVREPHTKEEMIERYLDEVFGLGPLEDLLADESITEIMVNGSRSLYFEREGKLVRASRAFDDDEQVYALIDRIIGPLGRRVDESSPMVNARLRQGHRVNAIIPPLALDGPIVTIRKFRTTSFSLNEMCALGTFDARMATLLAWAVKRRCNIAVSGGTGSGKTTLLNALSAVIPAEERIVTIEDSAELRFTDHPHVVRLEARPRNAEGAGEVPIRDLVINSLRMRPDRIVVGECRGAEALDMIQAMNTGHDGSLTTLHANSPEEGMARLSTMVRYGAELPVEVIEAQVARALDLVVQTARLPDGARVVCELASYEMDEGAPAYRMKRYFYRDFVTGRSSWQATPPWVDDLPALGIATSEEVMSWKQAALS